MISPIKKKINLKISNLLRSFGFEIRRVSTENRVQIEKRKTGSERDQNGYDQVWSNGRFVEQYGNDHKLYYEQLLKFVLQKNLIENMHTVADVGCGPGFWIKRLSETYPNSKLFGYDFSESALEAAKRICSTVDFFPHDIYDSLPQRFDVIFCCETLEHLLYPEKALSNVLDSVKVNCILTVPDGRIDTYAGHINFWSEESWRCFTMRWSEDWDIETLKLGTKLVAIFRRK